jgi:hypothetical protein
LEGGEQRDEYRCRREEDEVSSEAVRPPRVRQIHYRFEYSIYRHRTQLHLFLPFVFLVRYSSNIHLTSSGQGQALPAFINNEAWAIGQNEVDNAQISIEQNRTHEDNLVGMDRAGFL